MGIIEYYNFDLLYIIFFKSTKIIKENSVFFTALVSILGLLSFIIKPNER